jgi:hypothetical protein
MGMCLFSVISFRTEQDISFVVAIELLVTEKGLVKMLEHSDFPSATWFNVQETSRV